MILRRESIKPMHYSSSWDVIIVGGGIGGCSAGALLADAGERVLLLEKGQLGGRCACIDYNGYTLDLGGHLLRDQVIPEIYKKVGKPLNVSLPSDGMLLYEGNKWVEMREFYEKDELRKIIDELISSKWENLEVLDNVSFVDWLAERTKSEGMRKLFGTIGAADFNLINEEDIPASEELFVSKMSLVERHVLARTIYPIGGCVNIVSPLAEVIRENGGQVQTNSRVLEVKIEDGVVLGVEVEKAKVLPNEYPETELIEASNVICTLPIWDVLEVIPEDKIPQWYADKIKRLKGHPECFFGFYAGIDIPLLGRNLWCWSEGPRTKLPGWALSPSAYDPSIAPEGRHLIACGITIADRTDWLRDRKWLKEKFAELEAEVEELFPDLKGHFLWKKRYVVDNFGLLHKPGYVGFHRPELQVPGVDGLYVVSDTFRSRGIGVDASARAAISVVERILGKKFPEFMSFFHY